MLPITVSRENGSRHVRVSARELAALIGGIGAEGNLFLIVQRVPDLPDVFIQVWHRFGEGCVLEHRDGGPDRHFQVLLDTPEAAVAAMTGWARQERGWDEEFAWTRLNLRAPGRARPLKLDEHERAQLEARVRQALVGGYVTRAELAELAEQCLVSGKRRPVSPEQARELADRMWLERVGEQARWEGETDPERLTRAFTALEAAGITARENFTCCRSCGDSGIRAAAAPDTRGFVYFPSQGTDAAAAGRGLSSSTGVLTARRRPRRRSDARSWPRSRRPGCGRSGTATPPGRSR